MGQRTTRPNAGRETPRLLSKDLATLAHKPNLVDYEAECSRFDWGEAWKLLDGLPGGRGCNIAHEAVDRHAHGMRAGRPTIVWLGSRASGVC